MFSKLFTLSIFAILLVGLTLLNSYIVQGQENYESPVLEDESSPATPNTGANNATPMPLPMNNPNGAVQRQITGQKQVPAQVQSVPVQPTQSRVEPSQPDTTQQPKEEKKSWWNWWGKNKDSEPKKEKESKKEKEAKKAEAKKAKESKKKQKSGTPPPATTKLDNNIPSNNASQNRTQPPQPRPNIPQQNTNVTPAPAVTVPATSVPVTAEPTTSGSNWKDQMRAGNLPSQNSFNSYDGATIWAKVENEVVLESDIMSGVKKRLGKLQREAKKNGAPIPTEKDLGDQIEQWKRQILTEKLQFKVMYTRALAELPPENMEAIQTGMDKFFDDKQVNNLMKDYDVDTLWELEKLLREEGSSIEQERKFFLEQNLGMQWLQMKTDSPKEVRHDEVMDYYNAHIEQYTITPKARWEEIVVYKNQFDSREEAYKAIQKMGQAIVNGKSFADVAKEGSQGFTASDGGKRDWVSPDGLNSKPLNKALFEQPVGELSPRIIEDDNCFYIVRVLERHGQKMVPFEEAQTEIRKMMMDAREAENRQKAFEKVFKDAKIWTKFDGTPMK